MELLLLTLTSCALIAGIEFFKRRFSLPTLYTRRIIHIGTAVVAGIAPLFVTKDELIVVSIIFAVLLLAGHFSSLLSAIHDVERKTFGDVYLPLSIALSAQLFLPSHLMAFQFGIFIMGISDPLAGLVGEKFGKHIFTIWGIRKSLEGSLAFFVSALILLFLFAPNSGYLLILIPTVLTLIEFLLVYGLDNLALPIVAGYLFQFLILLI